MHPLPVTAAKSSKPNSGVETFLHDMNGPSSQRTMRPADLLGRNLDVVIVLNWIELAGFFDSAEKTEFDVALCAVPANEKPSPGAIAG